MNSKTFKACTTSIPSTHTRHTVKKRIQKFRYNFVPLWFHTLKQSHIHLSLPKANNALTVGMLHIALGIHNFENLRELAVTNNLSRFSVTSLITTKPFLSTQPWRRPSTSNKYWETNWNIEHSKRRKFNPKQGKDGNCLERSKWARV